MTPSERARLVSIIDHLNTAAEEFRASRDSHREALLKLIDANDALVKSISEVITANLIALDLFNAETGGQA